MAKFHSINGNEVEAHYAGGELLQSVMNATGGITGNDAEESAWLARTSEADGVASVKSIHGRTARWNQLIKTVNTFSSGGLTCRPQEGNYYTVSGTVSSNPATQYDFKTYTQAERRAMFTVGHKYLMAAWSPIATDSPTRLGVIVYNDGTTYQEISTIPRIITVAAVPTTFILRLLLSNRTEQTVDTVMSMSCFDLTAMFGAGSEPSTIEEFTALYPLPYYAYDAGSLLSVSMTGIETNGFNQWDGTFNSGNQHFDHVTGVFDSVGGWACTDKIPAFPDTVYYVRADLVSGSTSNIIVGCWDAGDNYLGYVRYGAWNSTTNATKPNTAYIRAEWTSVASVTNVCINLSDPTRNGTYEPYWQQTRPIPAGTLRGAGTVYDEQTETERITRVGEVALSEISWTYESNNKRFSSPVISTIVQTVDTLHPLAQTARLDVLVAGDTVYAVDGFTVASNKIWLSVEASQPTIVTSEALNTWLAANCPTMHVALATPTTTPIDPALNLTYRTEQGGTERVMVPTGELSAPPTIIAAQGYTAESLRDAALSAIAPVENGLASDNYGVGSYLVHGGQLCRVTTAIATGEAITIGTNVTATTVMAEVIALIAQ